MLSRTVTFFWVRMPKKKLTGEVPKALAVPRVGRDLPGCGSRWRILQDSAECSNGSPLDDRGCGVSSTDPSTACPDSASLDDMRDISRLLDSSLQSHSLYESFGQSIDTDWQVRGVDEILSDVRRFVHEQNPRRPPLDDSLLEKKVRDKRLEPHDSCLIILPDNRVQTMEDRLSLRVRAELLNEPIPGGEDGEEDSPFGMSTANHLGASKLTSEVSKSAAPARKKIRNPWYMDPKDWHNKAASRLVQKTDGLPYMPVELAMEFAEDGGHRTHLASSTSGSGAGRQGVGASGNRDENDNELRPLTQREKDSLPIINDYKEHCQKWKQRLPYFLL